MLRYITTQIDNTYIVWIETYNQFIQLAEPAYTVFKFYAIDYTHTQIEQECIRLYGLPDIESQRFVKEIIEGIDLQLQHILNQKQSTPEYKYPADDFSFEVNAVRIYQIGDKQIKVSYQTNLLEHYLHPLLCHLEIPDEAIQYDYRFDLFYFNEKVTFRHNELCLGQWDEDASAWIKGKFFIQLLNDIYGKMDSDWMTTLHASAVTNGKKAIAFSAASGSGKSTLAALMHANGFQLIADDFVAVDKGEMFAHPFPVAMTVKDGSLAVLSELYPSLNNGESVPLSHNRSGRYLSHEIALETCQSALPIKEMVFVEYNPQVEFEISNMQATEALQLIVDESWIQHEAESIAIFMQWLQQTRFYRLRYSNNIKAIEAVSTLFAQ